MAAANARPNVVFFIVDDTAHEFLGCYGGTVPTPHLGRLCEAGIRFDNAFCSSAICQPSRYSYLAGRYAGTCPDPVFLEEQPLDEPASVEFNVYLNPDIPSQGFLFREAGYRTGFAGKWHVGHPNDLLPVPDFDIEADPDDPGVDVKLKELQSIYQEEVRRTGGYDFADGIIWNNNGNWPLKALNDHHIEWSMQKALDFLDTCDGSQPFLLHYASTCTHGPSALAGMDRDWRYTPGGKMDPRPEPLPSRKDLPGRLRQIGVEVNDKHVFALWIDDQVGALLDKLGAMGATGDTVFIFCSDHNIEPGKATCYDRGTRVPLIISAPGLLDGAKVSDALVQNIDLMPTLLGLCGADTGGDVAFDGCDLGPMLRGETDPPHDALYFEVGYRRAVRTERSKYIALRFPERIIRAMREGGFERAPNHMDREDQPHAQIAMEHYPGYYDADQIYDLRNDPQEMHNLGGDPAHGRKLEELQGQLEGILKRLPHPYSLAPQDFLESEQFAGLAQKTRDVGTGHISWWNP